jgi:hypothetical protein
MARAVLRDSRDCGCYGGVSPFSIGVGLDDGCATTNPVEPEVPVVPLTVVQLRERYREGYDDDGNDRMLWRTLAEGFAITKLVRAEFDQDASATVVKGMLTMENRDGLTSVKESAVLVEGDLVWRISSADVHPDRIVLKIDRIDGGP